jgi:hypothetical protein
VQRAAPVAPRETQGCNHCYHPPTMQDSHPSELKAREQWEATIPVPETTARAHPHPCLHVHVVERLRGGQHGDLGAERGSRPLEPEYPIVVCGGWGVGEGLPR